MKLRFPLYAKILFWFFINLLALGIAAWWYSGAKFPPSLDSLLAGRAGDRIQAVTNLISTEVHNSPAGQWSGILKRFEDAYHVRFYLFNNDGEQLAGDTIALPDKVHARLVERPPQAAPQQRPPQNTQTQDALPPPPPPDADPANPYPPPPGMPAGAPRPTYNSGENPPLPGAPARFMVHTADPSRYWVVVRIAGVRARPESRPIPASVITVADTLNGGGLFFDPGQWLKIAAGAILFSALLWLPFVRGITRSMSQMTRATGLLAEGRFDVRVDDGRRDELGKLGVAINRMAARLAGYVGGQKRFLGDIAHELCSPLARAQMALSILEQSGGPGQQAGIADVREEIELMSNLVNELLSFSKASIGVKIKLQPVDLLPLVEKAVARETGSGAGTEVSVEENLRVMAEPELLLRCVANLVRNAIRYAAHAGPVTISALKQDNKVFLKVLDSGPGVPPEALAQVFDPFYRVDPSRARETGGVGLGLAIVKTCVESCGGTVSARNRLPAGLEVIIALESAGPA